MGIAQVLQDDGLVGPFDRGMQGDETEFQVHLIARAADGTRYIQKFEKRRISSPCQEDTGYSRRMSGKFWTASRSKASSPPTVRRTNSRMAGTGLRIDQAEKFIVLLPRP